MNQNLGPEAGQEYYAHENSEKVEKSERLRTGTFILLVFAVAGALSTYFLGASMVEYLMSYMPQVNDLKLEEYAVASGILLIFSLVLFVRLVKAIIQFSRPKSDKRKGMIKVITLSLIVCILLPLLGYVLYAVMQPDAWQEILSVLEQLN